MHVPTQEVPCETEENCVHVLLTLKEPFESSVAGFFHEHKKTDLLFQRISTGRCPQLKALLETPISNVEACALFNAQRKIDAMSTYIVVRSLTMPVWVW